VVLATNGGIELNNNETTARIKTESGIAETLTHKAQNRFVPADAEQPRFPKWVWFTNKDNHEATTQLTQAQSNRLLMKRKNNNAHQ